MKCYCKTFYSLALLLGVQIWLPSCTEEGLGDDNLIFAKPTENNVNDRSENTDYIELSSSSLLVDWIGDNFDWDPNGNSVSIATNFKLDELELTSSEEWLHANIDLNETIENSAPVLTIYADLNKAPVMRIGRITLSNGTVATTLTVIQYGIHEFPRIPPNITLGEFYNDNGHFFCTYIDPDVWSIINNTDVDFIIPEEDQWWLQASIYYATWRIKTILNLEKSRIYATTVTVTIPSHVFDKDYILTEIYVKTTR